MTRVLPARAEAGVGKSCPFDGIKVLSIMAAWRGGKTQGFPLLQSSLLSALCLSRALRSSLQLLRTVLSPCTGKQAEYQATRAPRLRPGIAQLPFVGGSFIRGCRKTAGRELVPRTPRGGVEGSNRSKRFMQDVGDGLRIERLDESDS